MFLLIFTERMKIIKIVDDFNWVAVTDGV